MTSTGLLLMELELELLLLLLLSLSLLPPVVIIFGALRPSVDTGGKDGRLIHDEARVWRQKLRELHKRPSCRCLSRPDAD